VQEIHSQLSSHNQQVQMTLGQLAGKRELTQGEFNYTLQVLDQAHHALSQALKTADRLRLPRLKNVTPGEPLGPALLSGPLIHRLSRGSNSLDGEWIGQFLSQLREVIDRAQRIHFKSLGGILAFQEQLAEAVGAQGLPSEAAG
jgi:hypothetical protein